jgi:hypothetical protein
MDSRKFNDGKKDVRLVYGFIFDRLVGLGLLREDGSRAFDESVKIESPFGEAIMPLRVDYLYGNGESYVIALAYNYLQEGDVMSDPDMEVRVWPKLRQAEALTFQQSAPPTYQQVYPEPGKVDVRLKLQLNNFLAGWLKNLRAQKFYYSPGKTEAEGVQA